MVQLLDADGDLPRTPGSAPTCRDLTRGRAARMYRDMATDPPVRPGGHRAPAPGPAGPVGAAARPGGRPGRLRPGRPAQRLHVPHLPRARRRPDPRRDLPQLLRCSAASPTAAGTRGKTTSTSTRWCWPPRRCTPPAMPWASRGTRPAGTPNAWKTKGRGRRLLRRRRLLRG